MLIMSLQIEIEYIELIYRDNCKKPRGVHVGSLTFQKHIYGLFLCLL